MGSAEQVLDGVWGLQNGPCVNRLRPHYPGWSLPVGLQEGDTVLAPVLAR